jgi:hypothetical protein
MSKTPQQLRANFKARHGYLPGEAKPTAAAAVPPLTAAQEKAVREALGSLPAAGSNPGASYAGADFQSMVEQIRERKGLSYADAYCAVIKTPAGQLAHKDFLRKKNPHIQID